MLTNAQAVKIKQLKKIISLGFHEGTRNLVYDFEWFYRETPTPEEKLTTSFYTSPLLVIPDEVVGIAVQSWLLGIEISAELKEIRNLRARSEKPYWIYDLKLLREKWMRSPEEICDYFKLLKKEMENKIRPGLRLNPLKKEENLYLRRGLMIEEGLAIVREAKRFLGRTFIKNDGLTIKIDLIGARLGETHIPRLNMSGQKRELVAVPTSLVNRTSIVPSCIDMRTHEIGS